MENLDLYNSFRAVPETAKKPIKGGRLKGMTDINPQWRIQTLTEKFGPCGIGWKFVILRKWMEHGPNDEVAAFVDIDLYYKVDGEWSAPVPGTGGSKFVAKEQSGLYVSDECFKMAVTDALSVAGKAIGLGADVYWANGKQTKYGKDEVPETPQPPPEIHICSLCGKKIIGLTKNGKVLRTAGQILNHAMDIYGKPLCWACIREKRESDESDRKDS